jgi:hypothetical protein
VLHTKRYMVYYLVFFNCCCCCESVRTAFNTNHIKCVLHVAVQIFFARYFAAKNIWWINLDIRAGRHKRSPTLLGFNQRWNLFKKNCTKIKQNWIPVVARGQAGRKACGKINTRTYVTPYCHHLKTKRNSLLSSFEDETFQSSERLFSSAPANFFEYFTLHGRDTEDAACARRTKLRGLTRR